MYVKSREIAARATPTELSTLRLRYLSKSALTGPRAGLQNSIYVKCSGHTQNLVYPNILLRLLVSAMTDR